MIRKEKYFIAILYFLSGISLFYSCSSGEDTSGSEKESGSPYISKVYDFMPAVGQFTNTLPEYETGDTRENMVAKAEKSIKGEGGSVISLGGFGGYVIFGFDHMVKNVKGLRDFRILGNAFQSVQADDSSGTGNSEPGVVMVSYDANGNGLPDDTWYEIAGSEYNNPKTVHNYTITYYKPDPNKKAIEDKSLPYISDEKYIYWKDSRGESGYKEKNTFHSQSYYPLWAGDSLSFSGTLLPDNGIQEPEEDGSAQYWLQYAYAYGYADNVSNNSDDSAIDIDWAVDGKGNPVHLPGINFVKVYSGINQECGWLGETSTEVAGAVDLHLLDIEIKTK